MKVKNFEKLMYLVRLNLFWFDCDGYHDFRESNILDIDIVAGTITLCTDTETKTWNLAELEGICKQHCEEHFKTLSEYVKNK